MSPQPACSPRGPACPRGPCGGDSPFLAREPVAATAVPPVQCSNLISSSAYNQIRSCKIGTVEISRHSSHFCVPITLQGLNRSTVTAAMIDSGATGLFLDTQYVKQHCMFKKCLPHLIKLYNIDGFTNHAGQITHSVCLMTEVDRSLPQLLQYLVTDLGTEDIIFGLP